MRHKNAPNGDVFMCYMLSRVLLRPRNEREHLFAIAEVSLVERGLAALIVPHRLPPFARISAVRNYRPGALPVRAARNACAERGEAIEERVDEFELCEVVRVRMFVRWVVARKSASTAVRIVRVIHARPKVRVIERSVLVIKAERMRHLLAHHELPPRRSIVFAIRWTEIRIVQLHNTLRDVLATRDPNSRDAEPTVRTIFCVTHFHAAAPRFTC